jgi:3',5'-nucleoside bisphosphate phosphatase|tara:strand:+ start:205 stop:1338 length:1134 start_codon:yes stop_codon:yes gene_type:complete
MNFFKTKLKYLLAISFVALQFFGQAQTSRKIRFPNLPNYLTLVTDLHQHSVFSDGSVWPDIRVEEAIFDGVDVISLTEHLEYQPHQQDIPNKDRNRSYDLAKAYAEGTDLIVIRGAEITRNLPPGHSNALFIQDANKLIKENAIDAFREAKNQGAFIFWNHPNWIGQNRLGISQLSSLHQQLIDEGLLNGIEVTNENTFAEQALEIANQNNLTIMGTSDVHGLIDWLFDIPGGGHRPVTLVFAKERSEDGVKDALFRGRTVVWYQNNLIGQEQYLVPLIQSSLTMDSVYYETYDGQITQVANVRITNSSDATYVLSNESDFSLYTKQHVFTIDPNTTTTLMIKTGAFLDHFDLQFQVLNATFAYRKHPTITIPVILN